MSKYLDERGDPIPATHDADRESFTAGESREGSLGVRVLAILGAGLFLALLVWGGAGIWGESNDNDRTTAVDQVQPQLSPEQTGSIDNKQGRVLAPTDTDPTADTGTGGEAQQDSPYGTVK
ncbi:hypothetical protein [Ensifer sp. LC163]|uniref:hypothetical protein n=1 Tax=Ensifer sp. LC163 TaxID=1120652 RepID=UPI0008130F15|nr:hypothetical protein [Ensifer sp. LC163]OCP17209.1 hypothetical protein BC360_13410 [Ensifer sp. LC163]